jgi:hypothetical protein
VFHFVIITNMKTIRYIAVVCNAIFVAWLLFNAIDEGFRAVNRVELVSMWSSRLPENYLRKIPKWILFLLTG